MGLTQEHRGRVGVPHHLTSPPHHLWRIPEIVCCRSLFLSPVVSKVIRNGFSCLALAEGRLLAALPYPPLSLSPGSTTAVRHANFVIYCWNKSVPLSESGCPFRHALICRFGKKGEFAPCPRDKSGQHPLPAN